MDKKAKWFGGTSVAGRIQLEQPLIFFCSFFNPLTNTVPLSRETNETSCFKSQKRSKSASGNYKRRNKFTTMTISIKKKRISRVLTSREFCLLLLEIFLRSLLLRFLFFIFLLTPYEIWNIIIETTINCQKHTNIINLFFFHGYYIYIYI